MTWHHPLGLPCLNIGFHSLSDKDNGLSDQCDFPQFFTGYWQSPCTALTVHKCLPLALCKETVTRVYAAMGDSSQLIFPAEIQGIDTLWPGHWFNIKMSSYQYRKSYCGDKMVVRSSYLHNGISYTGKMASLYWIGPRAFHKYCKQVIKHVMTKWAILYYGAWHFGFYGKYQ